ncbi:MAG: hypothetical protein A4E48_02744 [Methanosaeta sp. PtaU1.Bin060]|nr:MAG: hypothetical protein A4E48_02744 [Methanosaeta sp. PtaU1.Bin060]
MMAGAAIIYFPVGNGDTSLIRLSDDTNILIDCNITNKSTEDDEEKWYDLKDHLLKILRKDERGIFHIDLFILTHPDQDHCRGFEDHFYIGDPNNLNDSAKNNKKIFIDELWFTPRLFLPTNEDSLCASAQVFLKEARRRIMVYKENKVLSKLPGNRLQIIGYSDNKRLEGLKDIVIVPGTLTNLINADHKKDFSLFIHAPFRKDLDSEDSEKNETSVVFQARFVVDGEDRAGLALFGGDAQYEIWRDILDRSEEGDLQWDLFLAPHHCSWTFFSEIDYKDDPNPRKESLELLTNKRKGAIVIASCKPVKDDDDNPPHYQAAQKYKEIVGEKDFYVTMEYPSSEQPLPLEFEITKKGPQRKDPPRSGTIASSAAINKVVRVPQTYGF